MLTTAGKIWLCNGSDTDIDLPHGDLFGFSVGTWVDLSAGPLLQKFQNGFCIWKAPPTVFFHRYGAKCVVLSSDLGLSRLQGILMFTSSHNIIPKQISRINEYLNM